MVTKNGPDLDVQFSTIQEEINNHKTAETKSNKSLKQALKNLFNLGAYLLESERVEEFVIGKDKTLWTKSAVKKPFLPLVKLAFGETNKASQSQYSTIMGWYAHLGYENEQFSNAIDDNTLTDLYDQVLKEQREAERSEYEVSESDQLKQAWKKLDKVAPVLSTKLNKNDLAKFTDEGVIQQAAIMVSNGKLQILELNDVAQKKQDAVALRLAGTSPKLDHKRLADKNLYALFVACDWICKFPPNLVEFIKLEDWNPPTKYSATAPKAISSISGMLLSNVDTGWQAETVSTLPNFSCVVFDIFDDLDGLDPKQKYLLSLQSCNQFAQAFLHKSTWEITSQAQETLLKTTDGKNSFELSPIQPSKYKDLAHIDQSRSVEVRFSLTKAKLDELVHWKSQTETTVPTQFLFAVGDDEVSLAFPNASGIQKQVAKYSKSSKTSEPIAERYISMKMLTDLREASIAYDVNFTASFFSTNETACGIQCDVETDKLKVSVFLPLLVSKGRDQGNIVGLFSDKQTQ